MAVLVRMSPICVNSRCVVQKSNSPSDSLYYGMKITFMYSVSFLVLRRSGLKSPALEGRVIFLTQQIPFLPPWRLKENRPINKRNLSLFPSILVPFDSPIRNSNYEKWTNMDVGNALIKEQLFLHHYNCCFLSS